MSEYYGKCSTPGCPHVEMVGGLCQKCHGHAYYLRNRDKIRAQRRARAARIAREAEAIRAADGGKR